MRISWKSWFCTWGTLVLLLGMTVKRVNGEEFDPKEMVATAKSIQQLRLQWKKSKFSADDRQQLRKQIEKLSASEAAAAEKLRQERAKEINGLVQRIAAGEKEPRFVSLGRFESNDPHLDFNKDQIVLVAEVERLLPDSLGRLRQAAKVAIHEARFSPRVLSFIREVKSPISERPQRRRGKSEDLLLTDEENLNKKEPFADIGKELEWSERAAILQGLCATLELGTVQDADAYLDYFLKIPPDGRKVAARVVAVICFNYDGAWVERFAQGDRFPDEAARLMGASKLLKEKNLSVHQLLLLKLCKFPGTVLVPLDPR